MVEKMGGYPLAVIKKGEKIAVRFYPKSPNAMRPDKVIFTVTIGIEDIQNLLKHFT